MIRNRLITENQLDIWVQAHSEVAQGIIVELVYRLVAASSPKPKERRFPLSDSINQPGPDGYLNTDYGFSPFVPEGKSYWEIGTGKKPGGKATKDYKELTDAIPENERHESIFVFVTPLSAQSGWGYTWKTDAQAKWREGRQRRKEWRDVRVIDATGLIDWLSNFPSVEHWLAGIMGISVSQIQTPENIWSQLRTIGEPPPLPAQLFLVNREAACEKLREIFFGAAIQLKLDTHFPSDVPDFISAYISILDEGERIDTIGRCLIITGVDGWNEITNIKEKHILVAGFDLDVGDPGATKLLEKARRAGHAVIYGGIPGGIPHPNRVAIPNPKSYQIKETLEKAGYKEERARNLAQKSGEQISSLLRCILNLSLMPEWALSTDASELAIANLLGTWSEQSEGDKVIAEKLLGKPYGEWIGRMREIALRPSTPLIHRNGVWKFTARYEGWHALAPRIFDDQLDRFNEIVVFVLSERDPKFNLPLDEHYAANIHDKVLLHSPSLRNGLADTLALIGSYPQALGNCTSGKARATAIISVRRILSDADWILWASLNNLLPLLAEAAPLEFINAVENALIQDPSPFDVIYSQERTGITGHNYMTGLLWALETLAWDDEYLTRVLLILGDLAVRDPGGNWANRPINSIKHILLPWLPQTCANFEQRLTAVKTLLVEFPDVAWDLLIHLLPQRGQSSLYTRKPAWREIVPEDWKDGVTWPEYWNQVSTYCDLAQDLARNNISRIIRLMERMEDLPPTNREKFLDYLGSSEILNMPQAERSRLWNELMDLVAKNKRFSDAEWALSTEDINKISLVADNIKPKGPFYLYQRLFTQWDSNLIDEKGNYSEQSRKFEVDRQKAISEVFLAVGIQGILEFSKTVESPWRVGFSLGQIDADDKEGKIIPESLGSNTIPYERLASGFVLGKFRSRGWQWVDGIDMSSWSDTKISQFYTCLPFTPETWQRVKTVLGDNETLYWSKVNPNPYEAESGLEDAIDHLIDNEQPHIALSCLEALNNQKKKIDNTQAIRVIKGLLHSKKETTQMDEYAVLEIIKLIQDDPSTDPDDLFQIEWAFLPLLDRHNQGSPKYLENRMANDPAFFCEVLRAIFRSKHEKNHPDEPSEQKKMIASKAYRLLSNWRIPPGVLPDGTFSDTALVDWFQSVKTICSETGHLDIALIMVGHVLIYAPSDPDGLWLHRSVANLLNSKDADKIREGFTTELFNSRGVYSWTGGRGEKDLALNYRHKADLIEASGFYRLASALRGLADSYDHMAEHEASSEIDD